MKYVCIYGAASDLIPQTYKDIGFETGKALAEHGFGIVFGAGDTGLMGAVARGARAAKGSIIGIIPEKLNLPSVAFADCDKLIVTKTMRERKAEMEAMADAFLALPGGFGTVEELMEILTLKQLGYVEAPICILNVFGHYDSLLRQFDRMVCDGFMENKFKYIFNVAATPRDASEYLTAEMG